MADFPVEPISADIPADNAAAVTPSDSTDLTITCRGLYVGTGGDVAGITRGGQDLTFTAMLGGQVYPIRFARIKATGTTASNLIALW